MLNTRIYLVTQAVIDNNIQTIEDLQFKTMNKLNP